MPCQEGHLDELLDDALEKMNRKSKAKAEETVLPKQTPSANAQFNDNQLESMLEEFMRMNPPNNATSKTDSTNNTTIDATSEFEARMEKVLKEMENISPDFDKLVKDLDLGDEGNLAGDDPAQLTTMIEQMMMQLVDRDVLYEPFSTLSIKYPEWLRERKSKVSHDDYRKYERQAAISKEIVLLFDKSLPENMAKAIETKVQQQIFELMQEMQELGSLPDELLKNLGSTSRDPESASATLPAQCPQM